MILHWKKGGPDSQQYPVNFYLINNAEYIVFIWLEKCLIKD